jgi:hypothetical protein
MPPMLDCDRKASSCPRASSAQLLWWHLHRPLIGILSCRSRRIGRDARPALADCSLLHDEGEVTAGCAWRREVASRPDATLPEASHRAGSEQTSMHISQNAATSSRACDAPSSQLSLNPPWYPGHPEHGAGATKSSRPAEESRQRTEDNCSSSVAAHQQVRDRTQNLS